MLSDHLGAKITLEAGPCIRTEVGKSGHAVWGPYEHLEPGEYEVEFLLRRVGTEQSDEDPLCAIIDVATEYGQRANDYDFIFASQVGDEFTKFRLPFKVDSPAPREYRVHVTGAVSLDVCETRSIRRLQPGECSWLIPVPETPSLLIHNRGNLKSICDKGGTLRRRGSHLQVQLQGVTFLADRYDDINFVDELFDKRAYNFTSDLPSCVIDVGMNIGLASLMFAAKPGVREVHAFEPFPETFARAKSNLALNPDLARRVSANNFGLGDGDEEATFYVPDTHGDSGGQSIRSVNGGRPVQLKILDAGKALSPLLEAAKRNRLLTILKVDCEGSEFDVFRSIDRAGLWRKIDFLMVEWHRIYEGRSQEELIAPLRQANFVVVDISPDHGNGFFYAARVGG